MTTTCQKCNATTEAFERERLAAGWNKVSTVSPAGYPCKRWHCPACQPPRKPPESSGSTGRIALGSAIAIAGILGGAS